jgi:hypothetical protein
MPEEKLQKPESHDVQHQTASQPSLLDLPDLALAHIAYISTRPPRRASRHGHPLLQLSRGCRDAVLHNLTRICLVIRSPEQLEKDPEPWARLLHRACSHARPGLHVELNLWDCNTLLAALVQHGIESGGWSRVHTLTVSAAVFCTVRPGICNSASVAGQGLHCEAVDVVLMGVLTLHSLVAEVMQVPVLAAV